MFEGDALKRSSIELLEQRRLLSSVGWDGPGTGSAEVAYYVEPVPSQFELSEQDVLQVLEDAFAVWAEVADITFHKIELANQRDSIDIQFASIDGPGGILGDAYFPDDVVREPRAGNIRFDYREQWEIGDEDRFAVDFRWTAVHEIGHALGLEHSEDRNAVMFDSLGPFRTFEELHEDDIQSILHLYAAAPASVPGDLTNDDLVDSRDIQVLTDRISEGIFDREFDLNADGVLDGLDREFLIRDILKTGAGDANLDGKFDTSDLVHVFQTGNYISSEASDWSTGDWNGDQRFDTSDLILAFQAANFEITSLV